MPDTQVTLVILDTQATQDTTVLIHTKLATTQDTTPTRTTHTLRELTILDRTTIITHPVTTTNMLVTHRHSLIHTPQPTLALILLATLVPTLLPTLLLPTLLHLILLHLILRHPTLLLTPLLPIQLMRRKMNE